MKGGRVRCHFECPQGALIRAKGYIQVQLDFMIGEAKTHRLPVEIVERPPAKPPRPSLPTDDKVPDDKGDSTKVIKVKVQEGLQRG
jgi:hypothetical protein